MKCTGRVFSLTARLRTAEIRCVCTGHREQAFRIRERIREFCSLSERLLLVPSDERRKIIQQCVPGLESCNSLLSSYLSRDTPEEEQTGMDCIVQEARVLARELNSLLKSGE